jgi:hypothetical protein
VARFRNTRKVAAYAGFDPMERSSAERKQFLGISKAGSRVLRYLLVEAANIAVRKDEDLKRFYQRLAQRRGRPKAKVAAARKLLIRAYIMMRDEIDYAEFRRRAFEARAANTRGFDWAASLYCTPGASAAREVIAEVRTAGYALRVFHSHFLAQ